MTIERDEDLHGLLEAGRVVRRCLDEMAHQARPGITTADLNEVGASVLRRHRARSAPMFVYGFPAEVCISVNEEIVHGIPSGRVLLEGDLVKLDVTAEKNGYVADAAITVGVGSLSPAKRALIECSERAFGSAMSVARAGRRISEIGRAIEEEVRRGGFTVVRELAGHGVGRTIHEEPIVPNYDEPRARGRLREGLVLAIEPILAMGGGRPEGAGDGWTIRTADGSPAAHYEQTIVVTRDAPLLLTAAA